MTEMFTEIILDYYRHPRNRGQVSHPDASARDTNPLCGDAIEMSLKLDGKTIKDVKFQGVGCAISQAAASMLTEHMEGKSLEDIRALQKEDVLALLNIPISPVRLKCALLGLKVLKMAAYQKLGASLSREEEAL
ncbi:MAG TPA: SUF system NifU family Fe-S cluster assembly protein [Candidatus Binatia bacterium]|nr:SUF system NifU family Fe-S cluster assembly protein [Candidatus Binatia bacterium]